MDWASSAAVVPSASSRVEPSGRPTEMTPGIVHPFFQPEPTGIAGLDRCTRPLHPISASVHPAGPLGLVVGCEAATEQGSGYGREHRARA